MDEREEIEPTLPDGRTEEYEAEPEVYEGSEPEAVDYTSELEGLSAEFPDVNLGGHAERYSELRALGLSEREAFFASASRVPRTDNRAHLFGGMPKMAKSPMGAMPRRELEAAREIFSGLSDRQIEDLYKKVTK